MGSLLKSTYNTRYLIEDNPLYIRSDALIHLTESDIQWLLDHQVKTIVDLRDDFERKKAPCVLENDDRFSCHVYSLNGKMIPNSASEVTASYIQMMDETMNDALTFLLNCQSPVIYFCSAGKDRTGVLSALLLKKLGYEEQYIIQDYMKSKESLKPLFEKYDISIQSIIVPQESYMKGFLLQLKFKPFIDNAKILYETFQIKPLLYGSLGLEVLLKQSLNSDDIDILIPEVYIKNQWKEFKQVLENKGYRLIDEHEHTFIKDDIVFSYACIEELETFANIPLSDIKQNSIFQELNLRQYYQVYHASIKDGYRINHRYKKDQEKINTICEALLSLVEPTVDMLDYKEFLLADEKTMAYNHGTILFHKERWQAWHQQWIANKDLHYFYRYLYSHEYQCFVGEIAYHLEGDRYLCDVIIEDQYRHQLFGKMGLDLLIKSAREKGIAELYDDIALDNPAIHLFLNHGFELIETTQTCFVVKKDL